MSLPAASSSSARGTRKALALPLILTVVFLALGFLSRARTNPRLAWTFAGVAAFLLCWELALFLWLGRKESGFKWEFVAVRSHYVQALVQLSFYVYWGWYWRNVYGETPLILSQVVFFYIFDALLTWSQGQAWRLGFGAWPIIFSTNLFMWFHDDWFVFQYLMIAMGVLGKHFIRWRRGGKLTHIFNPSALALTIVSLVLIYTGTTGDTWARQIATTQGRPPYRYLEIFLGGLVVQYFFSVTLLTFSAAGVIGLFSLIYTKMTGVYFFFDSNIPIAVFLGLHLLMTDPATTPRSSLGKIMFGGLYGASVVGAVFVLDAIGAPTFYDKLLVVPILNLLVPVLDRLAGWGVAGKFGRWEEKVGSRKLNLAFMGGWVALFLAMLATGFVEAPHPGKMIGFWENAAAENRPNALKNLRFLLNEFDRTYLDGQSDRVEGVEGGIDFGTNKTMSHQQKMGFLFNQVALIYAKGRLVPADPVKAAHYFAKASELGNTEGCVNLAVEYFRTNSAVARADVGRALSTLEQSGAASHDGRVCCLVAYAYDAGCGVAVDKAKARQFFEKGAALGALAAWKGLARMQLAGEGGPSDAAAAANWLQKAADARDGLSCLYLAQLYQTGAGVPKDEKKSVALMEKACELGVKPACLWLQQRRR
jgi:TPR repeat protein